MGLDTCVRAFFAARKDRFVFSTPPASTGCPSIATMDMSIVLFSKPASVLTDAAFVRSIVRRVMAHVEAGAQTVVLLWDVSEHVPAAKVPLQERRDATRHAAATAASMPSVDGAFGPTCMEKPMLLPHDWSAVLGIRERRKAITAAVDAAVVAELERVFRTTPRRDACTVVLHPSVSRGGAVHTIGAPLPGECLERMIPVLRVGEADFRPAALMPILDPDATKVWTVDSVDTDTLMIMIAAALRRLQHNAAPGSVWWRPRTPSVSVPYVPPPSVDLERFFPPLACPPSSSSMPTPPPRKRTRVEGVPEFWDLQALAAGILAREGGGDHARALAWFKHVFAAALHAGSDMVEPLRGVSAKSLFEAATAAGAPPLLLPQPVPVPPHHAISSDGADDAEIAVDRLDPVAAYACLRTACGRALRTVLPAGTTIAIISDMLRARYPSAEPLNAERIEARFRRTEWALYYYMNGHRIDALRGRMHPRALHPESLLSLHGWKHQTGDGSGTPAISARANTVLATRVHTDR